jgi:hypothetical protein
MEPAIIAITSSVINDVDSAFHSTTQTRSAIAHRPSRRSRRST